MIITASGASSNSLFSNAALRNRLETASPASETLDSGTPAAERASRPPSTENPLVSHRSRTCFSVEDMKNDVLADAFVPRGGDRKDGAQTTPPQRKPPHLFKQLANEFRWMHSNLMHGYHSGSTPKYHQHDNIGFMLTPAVFREDVHAQDDEEELLTMSVRSSLRRSSRNQGAPTSASSNRKKFKTTVAAAVGSSGTENRQKTRWRTMENGEVEAVRVPHTTPDPYAPPDCHYVLRHPKKETDVVAEESRSASCLDSLHHQLFPSEESGEVMMPGAYLADSASCSTDDEDGGFPRQHSSLGRAGENDSSDLEAVATMGACPSDRHLAMGCSTSDGVLEEDACTHLKEAFDDDYDRFLFCVAELQRQAHQLEQCTTQLFELYAREQNARVRSKGKGQYLSWTRTVQAANTIHFWRMKVGLLRNFEWQYVSAVQQLRQELPLVDPEGEATFWSSKDKKMESAPSPLTLSRRGFLRSSRVIAAQRQHLQALAEELKRCWQANANLRDELRQFEQWEVRRPHETFAVAGMDAEHFIASLPPRISAYALCNGSPNSSLSLDSIDDDAQEPRLLLTAQNLSPSSDDDTTHAILPSAQATAAPDRPSNLACATGDATLLTSCMKGAAAPFWEDSAASLPSSAKRLKYVIQSVVFNADDETAGGGDLQTNSTSEQRLNKAGSQRRNSAALSTSFGSQQQQRGERHVTFVLEPEVLDARPRLSAHGRTIELLEQICMDKQVPWNGLTMLQTALDERLSELSAMQHRMKDEPHDPLTRAATSAPICANEQAYHTNEGRREALSRPESASSPSFKSMTAYTYSEKAKSQCKGSKVEPKECAQCSVM